MPSWEVGGMVVALIGGKVGAGELVDTTAVVGGGVTATLVGGLVS